METVILSACSLLQRNCMCLLLLLLLLLLVVVVLKEHLMLLSVPITLLISYKHLLRKRTVSTAGTSFGGIFY